MKNFETKLPPKANKTWGTVKQAAAEALMDIGESTHRMDQFIKWGLEDARNYNFDINRQVKSVKIPLNSYKAIDVPDDFVDYLRIGYKDGNMIIIFDKDPGISNINDCEDGEIIENIPDRFIEDASTVDDYFLDHFLGDNGKVFGLKYKHNGVGYFKYIREAGQIQFRSVLSSITEIYMDYISDGWDPCNETLLHPYYFKLNQLYQHWQFAKFKRQMNPGLVPKSVVDDAKGDYWDEHSRVQAREFDLGIEDIYDCMRQAYSLSPKI